jgi:hypothetical protein
MRKLVMIHGRSQQFKDSSALKKDWVSCLHSGLTRAGSSLEIPDDQIRFPYYGQTLYDLAKDVHGPAAQVVVKGHGEPDQNEREFLTAVVAEAVQKAGITNEQIRAEYEDGTVIEKNVLNWPWTLAALRAIDRVPGLGGASLALATRDVYKYLRNPGIQTVIEKGVRTAMPSGEEAIVVAHSLGTVIAYNLLRREAKEQGWRVPLLITVGSPLAVGPIVQALSPISRPASVRDWFNAFDPADVVALHPLDHAHFPVKPEIENYAGVHNSTSNRHGISGYLGDPTVAVRIRDALLA